MLRACLSHQGGVSGVITCLLRLLRIGSCSVYSMMRIMKSINTNSFRLLQLTCAQVLSTTSISGFD